MSWHPQIAFAMDVNSYDAAFTPDVLDALRASASIVSSAPLTELDSPHARDVLAQTEILISGWGVPDVGPSILDKAPNLRAIVHAAGTVRLFLDPEILDRGIRVSSCASANAIPVAEFALASTIFGLKRASRFVAQLRQTKGPRDVRGMPTIGTYRVVVGVIGASRVGREMLRMLRSIDVDVLLYDPFLSADDAEALGATLVTLPELCQRSDAVSIHAPLTDETVGMIGAEELALMHDGTVIVNTARGALIDTQALTPELVSGRLDAYLDVVDPEPLPGDSPLYDLPNVVITPHIAGALGNEITRLGKLAAEEVRRFAREGVFDHEVRAADLAIMA